jgi:hypothetical protein
MQYQIGKVFVINASVTAYANDVADWTSLVAGNLFSVSGDRVAYEIASIAQVAAPAAYNAASTYTAGQLTTGTDGNYYVAIQAVPVSTPPPDTDYWMKTSLWQITLSAPYAGVTGANKGYCVTVDFTPNFNLPLIQRGDIQTGVLLNRALSKIDDLLVPLGTQAGIGLATLRDDFFNGGELSWQFTQSGGSKAMINAEANHPGILQLTATSDGWALLTLGTNSMYPFIGPLQNEFDLTCVFRLPSTLSEYYYVGIGFKNPNTSQVVTSGCHLYAKPGDSTLGSNFTATSITGPGASSSVIMQALDNNWHR